MKYINLNICKPFMIAGIMLVLAGCGNQSDSDDEDNFEQDTAEDTSLKEAVCLWQNIGVRAEPSASGKYLASLNIGEKVVYLDSIVVDSNSEKKYEYVLIELSDKTRGWARKDFIFPEVRLVAVLHSAPIHARPDLLTATDKAFEAMDLVIIEEVKGDWLKVKGKIRDGTWFSEGWIQSNAITEQEGDVLAAQLVYKGNASKDKSVLYKELKVALENDLVRYSNFAEELEIMQLQDPEKLMKEEFHVYYQDMIRGMDSIDWWTYDFDNSEPVLTLQGVDFGEFEYRNTYEPTYGWHLFSEFSSVVAHHLGFETDATYYVWEDRVQAMSQLSGTQVYSKTEDDGALFSYVNRDFVVWVKDHLIPHPESNFLGASCQQIYDLIFRSNVRKTYQQYINLVEMYDIDDLADEYTSIMYNEGFSGFNYLRNYFENTSIDPILAGSLIRRAIDQSLDEVVAAMEKVLILYDRDWFNEVRLEM